MCAGVLQRRRESEREGKGRTGDGRRWKEMEGDGKRWKEMERDGERELERKGRREESEGCKGEIQA